MVSFNHNGLKVLRPQTSAGGSSATFTWYTVGEQVPINISSMATSEPSVSMDFHLVAADGNNRTMTFKQTFANALWQLDTRDGLWFPTPFEDLQGGTPQEIRNRIILRTVFGMNGTKQVASEIPNSIIFTYSDPNLNTDPIDRPLYQGQALQSAAGHISWNNNYNMGASQATQFKITPMFSHNHDRIWRIEATFS